jgi:anti-anti-sigma factor
MDKGRVLHASHEGVEVLRYVGDIRYTLAPSLARFLDDLFSRTTPVGFVVDLHEAGTIDSTNLGLLVRIAKRMEEKGGPRLTVISGQEDIDDLLGALGLDEVFDIVGSDGHEREAEQEVPMAKASGADVARTVLAAHRLLMDLNEHNRDQFRDVVALFEQQAAGAGDPD